MDDSSSQPAINSEQAAELGRVIGASRHFRAMAPDILESILCQGHLVSLRKDEYLMRQGDTGRQELYLLVEGSLAIITDNEFILRLDLPGDVVGEMGVIQSAPRSADVVAESNCRLVMFPAELMAFDSESHNASVLYVLVAHYMAAKLRYTTAQALIRRNQRVSGRGQVCIGVMDTGTGLQAQVGAALDKAWPDARLTALENDQQLMDRPDAKRFDYLVVDPAVLDHSPTEQHQVAAFLRAIQLRGARVVVVSELCSDPDWRRQFIELGVDELVARPCTVEDLQHVIARSRTWYYKDLELDEAENAAQTDRLTGLANRRRLDDYLDALITVYPEQKTDFSVVISDVDNFKLYNDQHGHRQGDRVLARVAELFRRNVRRGDLAARYGGEEFVIVLPNCGKARALDVAEGLRRSIEQADFPHEESQPGGRVTATFGVATFPGDAADLESLLQLADESLYLGKQRGKNVVIAAGSPDQSKV